jgi:lysophospholipase L1-like esterase
VDDKTRSSPFVFASGQPPAPKLDVQRYLSEHCGGRPPDFVTFLLGINDCFGLNTDTPESIDSGVRKMLKEADTLLAAFRKAAPMADLGVCLTPPPNDREEAFVANYKTKYTRANWLKVQRRLVELQIQHFSHRENDRIHVVPTGFNLDTWNGYPENNAVHPNPAGYQQIGSSIYAWLKWRLERADAGTAGRQP